MTFTFFRIEDLLAQLGLFLAAASLYLWHHRRPKVSPRKVRVDRDYRRPRRSR